MEQVDTMFSTWIEVQNQCHLLVSLPLLQAKALSSFEGLS
jgi:hypothetical protein